MKGIYFIFLFIPFFTRAQIITTVAGSSTAGHTGDGGPAIVATINHPIGVAVDATGNIYIGDYNNNCVRKVSTSGVITTFAGNGISGYSGDGGPAILARLYKPYGVTVDASGNVYIADTYNHCIRKVNPSGVISTIAGTGTGGYSGDGVPATSTKLMDPIYLRLDNLGNIYIADNGNHRIRKINTSGIISTVAGNGVGGYSGDGGPATAAQIHFPCGVWIDNTGNLFIADGGVNAVIREVNTLGIISTIAGNGTNGYIGDGGPATLAELNYPADVILDNAGNMYIADNLNNVIRKVNTSGIITTIVGNGTPGFSGDGGLATVAELNGINEISFNGTGDLYITDVFNNRIRKVGGMIIVGPVYTPYFSEGDSQNLTLCIIDPPVPVSINSLLSVIDSDATKTLTWSLITAPSHGSALVSYSTVSTGGLVTPTGLTYMPVSGYVGSDMFKIGVTDGIASDTVTINVTINAPPSAGVISGVDSVCPNQTITLSETILGGIWSCSSILTTITPRGIVTGKTPGIDTIVYTVINACGISSAIYPFNVRSYLACYAGINNAPTNTKNSIYPNPSKGRLTINLPSSILTQEKVVISNVLGQVLRELFVPTNTDIEIEVNLPPNIYFIEAQMGSNRWIEKLVITQN